MVFALVGAIITIGFLANVLFNSTRLPDTIFLIFVGIILGPVFRVFPPDAMMALTPYLATLTLMIILFDGGLNMDLWRAASESLRAMVLGILYVVAVTLFMTFLDRPLLALARLKRRF
ncbi:MAG: cation:proton antiporter [Nitrososphaerota archaeon]|nr:cation:proton antiporter [Candidatus Bathyarchaeota archaeon]MDW8048222.1 cation:proton antiporter [Nitrososphaerota archaeon]